jgi:hypothetical protein
MTNANGAKTVKTRTQLGIPEIDLTDDATRIVAQDGSVIEGQTTFKKSDGSTGTVASTRLVAEAEGTRVTETVSTDARGNVRFPGAARPPIDVGRRPKTWRHRSRGDGLMSGECRAAPSLAEARVG